MFQFWSPFVGSQIVQILGSQIVRFLGPRSLHAKRFYWTCQCIAGGTIFEPKSDPIFNQKVTHFWVQKTDPYLDPKINNFWLFSWANNSIFFLLLARPGAQAWTSQPHRQGRWPYRCTQTPYTLLAHVWLLSQPWAILATCRLIEATFHVAASV